MTFNGWKIYTKHGTYILDNDTRNVCLVDKHFSTIKFTPEMSDPCHALCMLIGEHGTDYTFLSILYKLLANINYRNPFRELN